MSMQAAAEKLQPVFTAVLADVRALFNILRLIICFDHRTRRSVSNAVTNRRRGTELPAAFLPSHDTMKCPMRSPTSGA
jgi:hypothetical protein